MTPEQSSPDGRPDQGRTRDYHCQLEYGITVIVRPRPQIRLARVADGEPAPPDPAQPAVPCRRYSGRTPT
jgi:hypothetical protein